MPVTVGTNSWTTIAEADTYLTDRIGAEDWFDLSDTGSPGADSKTTFIISAYYWLKNSAEVEIAATVADSNVKNAQAEAALFLLNHYNELNERRAAIATGLKSFQYSRRREELNYSQLQIPVHILNMLSDYATLNTTALLKGEFDA